jgi:SET domain-containing protein
MEEFISHLASAKHNMKPNIFKLLKYMNKDIKESANINTGPRKETFYDYYKELWTNNFLQEYY